MAILDRRPEDAQLIHLIIGSFAAAGLMLSLALSGQPYTLWPDPLADCARDEGQWLLRSAWHRVHPRQAGAAWLPRQLHLLEGLPHALIVAPTGRGKTTGFVIPNLLTWQGSAVTLDVKGECFEATARHRAAQGDKVYRFAPTDWEGKRTHRYNPLLRIYQLKDPARQQMELQLLRRSSCKRQ